VGSGGGIVGCERVSVGQVMAGRRAQGALWIVRAVVVVVVVVASLQPDERRANKPA
jgi:hypothetical protein